MLRRDTLSEMNPEETNWGGPLAVSIGLRRTVPRNGTVDLRSANEYTRRRYRQRHVCLHWLPRWTSKWRERSAVDILNRTKC